MRHRSKPLQRRAGPYASTDFLVKRVLETVDRLPPKERLEFVSELTEALESRLVEAGDAVVEGEVLDDEVTAAGW